MLKYIGKGSFRVGIPSRDLSDTEVIMYGGEEYLIETGLYARASVPEATDKPKRKSKKTEEGLSWHKE